MPGCTRKPLVSWEDTAQSNIFIDQLKVAGRSNRQKGLKINYRALFPTVHLRWNAIENRMNLLLRCWGGSLKLYS